MSSINKQLSRVQEALINRSAPITALTCGLGCGKSVGMAWASFISAYGGEHCLGSAPTSPMLSGVLVKETCNLFVDNNIAYKHIKSPYHYIQVGKGDIDYRSGFVADSSRGINADSLFIDEVCYLKDRKSLDTLTARSGRGPKKRYSVALCTTPKGKQNFLYSVLYDENGKPNEGIEIITGCSLDSPFLSDDYKRSLIRTYVPGTAWFEQEVEGKWVDWSGGLILSHLIKPYKFLPALVSTCRAWDTASSTKTSADYTASCLLGIDAMGFVYVLDVTQWKGTFAELKPRIVSKMCGDPRNTSQVIEDTQAGQVIRSILLADKDLHGVSIFPIPPIDDKTTRAMPYASRVAAGMVYMMEGSWNRPWLDEQSGFGPKCEHDDMVDATAHAYNACLQSAPIKALKLNL